MKNTKTLSTVVPIQDYIKVIEFLSLYNSKTNGTLSLSQFVWRAIRHYINYCVKQLKNGWNPYSKYPFGLFSIY